MGNGGGTSSMWRCIDWQELEHWMLVDELDWAYMQFCLFERDPT